MAKRILLVDDEPFNLELMSELLEGEGYQTDLAENGEHALAKLADPAQDYAAMLLDKMMPGMGGFEVLRRIKAEPRLAFLPVILQTAVGTAASVQEGLAAGAFYYLTKPFSRDMLLAVVAAAAEHWDRHQHFRTLSEQRVEALRHLTEARFSLSRHEEARNVTALLAQTCPHPERVATGLFELIVNAIEHGNLELGYLDKGRLQQEERWEDELERRHADPRLGMRRVTVSQLHDGHSIRFTICDEGQGFDWQSYLSSPADAIMGGSHGRGILIAQKLSFDRIEYQGNGSTVVASIVI